MNIFDYTSPESGETLTTLLKHKNIKINRIVSSEAIEPIEYIQEEDEWIVLIEGEATVLVENAEKKLIKGNTLFIAANVPHKVLETKEGTVWLTVHIF